MAQIVGRIPCARCGANNFEAAPVCWQCGAPLREIPAPVPGASAERDRPNWVATAVPAVYGSSRVPPPVPAAIEGGDPALAKRAAIYLAISCPYFGLPIGWAFMMLPDARKQAIGKYCAYWSAVALVFHLLGMFVMISSLGGLVSKVVPNMSVEKQLEDQIKQVGTH